jgi:transcriptional regulator with XRE-family HTH domain
MSKNINMDFQSMTDRAILQVLGQTFQQMRLSRNIAQEELAAMAGVDRTTIGKFEAGRPASLLTVVQILRALGELDLLGSFKEAQTVSPLQLLAQKKKERQKASGTRAKKRTTAAGEKSEW